jgi:hypothetical protein
VLKGASDPDLEYNRLIRPWKSRLALAYIDNRSFAVDIGLILLTIVAIVSRPSALAMLGRLLNGWNLHPLVIRMAARQEPLMAYSPPGGEIAPQRS